QDGQDWETRGTIKNQGEHLWCCVCFDYLLVLFFVLSCRIILTFFRWHIALLVRCVTHSFASFCACASCGLRSWVFLFCYHTVWGICFCYCSRSHMSDLLLFYFSCVLIHLLYAVHAFCDLQRKL